GMSPGEPAEATGPARGNDGGAASWSRTPGMGTTPDWEKKHTDHTGGRPSMLTRQEVRSVPCPQCGPPAGEPCRDGAHMLKSNHSRRIAAAEIHLSWIQPGSSITAGTRRKWRQSRYHRR